MSDDLFRKEAVEHQRKRLYGEVLIIQPASFYTLTLALILTFVFIIFILIYGSYARREAVSGYVVPDKGLVKVFAPANGVVSQIFVKEQQSVKENEVIALLSLQRYSGDNQDIDWSLLQEYKVTQQKVLDKLKAQQAFGELEEIRLSKRITLVENEVLQIQKNIKLLNKRVMLSKENLEKIKNLKRSGAISEKGYQEALEDNLKLSYEIEQHIQNKQIKSLELEELRVQVSQFPWTQKTRVAELQTQLSSIKQKIIEIEGRRFLKIKAPIEGIVTSLHSVVGQSTSENYSLLTLVPKDSVFQVHLFLPTRAAGFVRKNQEVQLKYRAFPYQRFGMYQGNIIQVASSILAPNEIDAPVNLVEPVYRIIVEPNTQYIKAYGEQYPLQAGMLLDADIILEKRTLIEWLLEPIISLKGRI